MTPSLSDLISRVEGATEWRPVPGWPYEASDTGVLRSTRSNRPLKPSTIRGYEKVTFQVDRVRKNVRVHRAIYEAWYGQIAEGAEINHLDGNKRNNRPINLESCTGAENVRHAAKMGLMASGDRNGMRTRPESRVRGSAHPNTPLTEADIPEIRKLCAGGERQTSIAQRYGVSKYAIHQIVKGKSWTHV